jgi:hypothetical protein
MKHIVVTTQAHADKISADTDALLGMPWQPTAFIGAGPHVRQATTRYAVPVKHPTENRWAYPSCGLEDEDDGKGGKKLKLPASAQVKELKEDWTSESPMPARAIEETVLKGQR